MNERPLGIFSSERTASLILARPLAGVTSCQLVDRKKNHAVYFFSVKRVLSRETASAARLLLRIVRRAVSRAPSTFGGFADNMRRQVLAFTTMTQRHSFSSFAIGSVIRLSVVTVRNERVSTCSSGCDGEF